MQAGTRTPDLLFDAGRAAGVVGREIGVDLSSSCAPSSVVIGSRYRLEERVGSGAFGHVYRAVDLQLPREVAIKVVDRAGFPEALALARLAHPNLVRLYDWGEASDHGYLVLELLRGETLTKWLARRQPERLVLAAFREAALGLAAMHAAGFVHRDFKPGNVMIVEGRAVVVDMGVASAIGSTPSPGGTLRYMAPEQHLGQTAVAESDQFSFCVALWEALSGSDPFRFSSALGRFERLLEGPVGRPPGPRRVARALRRGLAQSPARRHATMVELADSLRPRPPVLAIGGSLVAGAVVAALALGSAGASEPARSEVGQTLDLASSSASAGDAAGTVQYLEAARSRARRDFDQVELLEVAEAAEVLGGRLLEQDDEAAVECWNVAVDIYIELGDRAEARRVHRLVIGD